MADIHLKLETFQALILSRAMALSGNADLKDVILKACAYYTKALEAKRDEGLVQVWYPVSGVIDDVTP